MGGGSSRVGKEKGGGRNMLEKRKKVKVYCPQCGKLRGVSVWSEWNGMGYNYYVRCRNCKRRWQIIDMGVDDV